MLNQINRNIAIEIWLRNWFSFKIFIYRWKSGKKCHYFWSWYGNMGLSVHIYNKNKDILILGEGPAQGLDDTSWTAEAEYPMNFTQSGKRFKFSLHYNESNSFLFVNATKYINFNQKTLKKKILYIALR